MKLIIFTFALSVLTCVSAQAQNNFLNWMISAQAGTTNNKTTNYQGALLIGFKTENNQQVSIGPVMKGFNMNRSTVNFIGARLYSQVNLTGNIGLYLQCDVLKGNRPESEFDAASIRPVPRLETSMGFEYMFLNNLGLSGGYNFQDYDPIANARSGSFNVRAIYNLPLSRY